MRDADAVQATGGTDKLVCRWIPANGATRTSKLVRATPAIRNRVFPALFLVRLVAALAARRGGLGAEAVEAPDGLDQSLGQLGSVGGLGALLEFQQRQSRCSS